MNGYSKNSKAIYFKESDTWIPVNECTPGKELRHLIKNLSPKAVGHDLIRIGRDYIPTPVVLDHFIRA